VGWMPLKMRGLAGKLEGRAGLVAAVSLMEASVADEVVRATASTLPRYADSSLRAPPGACDAGAVGRVRVGRAARVGLMKRLLAALATAVLAVGCSANSSGPMPAETVPPPPTAPAGWASIAGIGGTGGQGGAGIALPLDGHATAIDAACSGNGTLVVQFGDATYAPTPAVAFHCGGHGEVAVSRYELASPIQGTVTVIASVIQGAGDLYNSSFWVSIEQPRS